MRLVLFSALFLGGIAFLFSQNSIKKDTLSFIVNGNCGMCKKTIESVQYEKGVVVSDWNKATKEIIVIYKPHKIREDEIHKFIAKKGYDTNLIKAEKTDYEKLHFCCKYRND